MRYFRGSPGYFGRCPVWAVGKRAALCFSARRDIREMPVGDVPDGLEQITQDEACTELGKWRDGVKVLRQLSELHERGSDE